MRAGDLIEGRYELLERVGAGSSGEVFRALDRSTGQQVACKVQASSEFEERFDLEASALAALSHPCIVRHLGHGLLEGGQRYLVLEWLSGETLEQALARGPLGAGETAEVARQVASALAVIHAQGLLHGDLTPSNVMLEGGVSRVVLIDFGVARGATQVGDEGWGTPGYAAPERVQGQGGGPASDVFSLGCVLFRCLAGQGPFAGATVAATIAKVLLSPPPPLSSLRGAGAAPGLEELIGRMLAKAPEQRPRDGAAVEAELGAIGASYEAREVAPALTRRERRSLTSLLVAPGVEVNEARLRAEVGGAKSLRLVDGSLLVLLDERGVAAAERAATAALALRAEGERGVAVATARAGLGGEALVGEAIDRGMALLHRASVPDAPGPLLDDATAGLLAGRFRLYEEEGGGWWLLSAWQGVGSLLVRASAFSGRKGELLALDGALREALSGDGPRAALVLGEAGAGKTRLLREWMAGGLGDAAVWVARGDPLTAGSPFGMLGQLLRHAAGVSEDDGPWREALRARVTSRLPGGERAAGFLEALASASQPGGGLRPAAHEDPALLREQAQRSWEEWLAAECAAQPVILVLDDLQWADMPSVRLLGASLRALRGAKLLVLGLADPEIDLLFPSLWAGPWLRRVPLSPLSEEDGLAVARAMAPDGMGEVELRELVERAGGNPFFLEELVRARVRGVSADVPDTALAVLEGRLSELSSEGRRALRAASCFGLVFWRGGIAELLGGDPSPSLRELIDEGMIVRRASSRFAGEEEFGFRQALVRGVAHAMLTADDLRTGHALAGRWLERHGERDAAALAEHFERGGQADRAVVFFKAAAEQALAGDDAVGAVAHAERALRAGAQGSLAGELRLLQAEALHWQGELDVAERCAESALDELAPDTASWFQAMGLLASICARLDDRERLSLIARRLLQASVEPSSALRVAAAQTAIHLIFAGDTGFARSLIDRVSLDTPTDPSVKAWLCRARAQLSAAEGNLPDGLRWTELAAACHREAGDLKNACIQLANAGSARNEVGCYEEAEAHLREAVSLAERLGVRPALAVARLNLGMTLARLGKLDEALRVEREAIELLEHMGHRRLLLGARSYLSRILLLRGDAAGAADAARLATADEAQSPTELISAQVALSSALLAQGDAASALALSSQAFASLAQVGHLDEGESALRCAHAEALLASRRGDEARAVVSAGRDWLLRCAAGFPDEALRRCFLSRAADNVRLLALAERLGC